MYKTSDQADKARAIWNEAMNSGAANSCVSCVAFDAGDNAAATVVETTGNDYRDPTGYHTDEFVFWWEQSLISILSDHSGEFNTPEVRQWYADRGITA